MIYIEGTDGVGKTTTIECLKKIGINCIDRNKEVISKNMLFEVSMEERAKTYEEYLINNEDIIIFLINNSEKELMDRIYARKEISDFDLDAVKYNQLYLDTYNYMKNKNMLHNKLFIVNCTGLNLQGQVKKVEELIKKINA